jgi:lipopolysaccharide transport system permease protein
VIEDLKYCFKNWRLIHLIGIAGLRARYSRSKLGQFWLTLFTFVQIFLTGIIWSIIWKVDIKTYLPYVGVGHLIYLYISQSINESSGCIVAEARLFTNDPMPLLVAIFSHCYRQLIIFLHNLPILFGLILYKGTVGDWYIALSAFIFCMIFIFLSSVLLSLIATRFRDVIQLISLVFQICFLVTPIMWNLELIPDKYQIYFLINPLAALLELIRNPLLGMKHSVYAFPILLTWTVVVLIMSILVYSKYRRKLIYWI